NRRGLYTRPLLCTWALFPAAALRLYSSSVEISPRSRPNSWAFSSRRMISPRRVLDSFREGNFRRRFRPIHAAYGPSAGFLHSPAPFVLLPYSGLLSVGGLRLPTVR